MPWYTRKRDAAWGGKERSAEEDSRQGILDIDSSFQQVPVHGGNVVSISYVIRGGRGYQIHPNI